MKNELETSDAIVIGAGAGMSTSAGMTYDGERFEHYFSDFHKKYGIRDMYSGGLDVSKRQPILCPIPVCWCIISAERMLKK